ncbi:MAG: EF-hand domain-containing protein [Sulfuricurvum sp.]|uniref:EF-hand domain-containing protein n=1 Tax=Sulfuricurvum sp. TaxID=2025608 RepID=UPI0026287256|nr:EF-hand domain-containing protein [Sulfuricurvum sp.]MDD5159530.1 EF-hand domain-containing protein [Sulfuricurvum sp.]
MTINGGSVWATPAQSYSNNSVQSQSSASGMAPTDYSTVMQQAGNTLIATLDSDKSGTIDKAEFSQAAQALAQKTGNTYNVDTAFNAIDKNSDGSISADELLNALKQARSQNTHHHGMHKTDAQSATGQTTASTTESASASETSSSSKLQSILMQRILSAYTGGDTKTGSTTLATA